MSPEQLAGQPVDARSDLYSAAVVIHEALTGQLPYVSGKKLSELCPEATPDLQELLDQCLKPNPAERPPSAVEVYLRLQELGKASGILLLPPGAMEKLAAARATPASRPSRRNLATTKTLPPGAANGGRWWALSSASCVLLALATAIVLVKFLWPQPSPTTPPVKAGPESLLGVMIGDPQQEVVEKLDLLRQDKDPWAMNPPPEYLGLLAQKPRLLGVEEDARKNLQILHTTDEKVSAAFLDGKLRVLVVHRGQAQTGRGVGVSSPSSLLDDRYGDDESQSIPLTLPGMTKHTHVRVYTALGVAFEIQEQAVTRGDAVPPRRRRREPP